MTDGPQQGSPEASQGQQVCNAHHEGSSQADAPQQLAGERWLIDRYWGASERPHPSPGLRPDYAFAAGEDGRLQASCFIHGARLPTTITGF